MEKEIKINKPITLEWNSPDGFIFTRVISIDENYMFTIEQKIKNNSNNSQISFLMEGLIELVHQIPQVSISFMKALLRFLMIDS